MWSHASMTLASEIARSHPFAPPELDRLMLFGFLSALATVLCFIEQRRSRLFVFGFALCSLLLSIFGFMQGAWPLGIVQAVWSVEAFCRWNKTKVAPRDRQKHSRINAPASMFEQNDSRIARLFGPRDRITDRAAHTTQMPYAK